MSFWENLFGKKDKAPTTPPMFKQGQSKEQMIMEIVKQLTVGTKPEAIVDNLVRELGMPKEVASNIVALGQQAFPGNSST